MRLNGVLNGSQTYNETNRTDSRMMRDIFSSQTLSPRTRENDNSNGDSNNDDDETQ